MTYRSLLKQKNIALLFWGQFVSNLGNSINILGLSWFILTFNSNLSHLAVLMIFRYLPSVIIGPFAGTVVDRLNKKQILILTDILQGVLSILLIIPKRIEYIYLIVFLQSVLFVFFSPAIRSLLPRIVKNEELQKVNALNAISHRISMLSGPLIGGALLYFFGVKSIFIINGISFMISAFTEMFINYKHKINKSKFHFKSDMVEAYDYIMKQNKVKFVIIFFTIMSITGGAWSVLYKGYLQLELNFTGEWYSIILAFLSIGSILGAYIIGKKNIDKPIKVIINGFYLYMICYFLMGIFSQTFLLILIFTFTGMFAAIVNIGYDIYLQTYVDKDLLGRVFSFDIALGNLALLLSLYMTSILTNYFDPATLLVIFSLITMVLIGLSHIVYKKTLE